MTWVTVDNVLSPAINVRSNTPLVQNVKSVFGETLFKKIKIKYTITNLLHNQNTVTLNAYHIHFSK